MKALKITVSLLLCIAMFFSLCSCFDVEKPENIIGGEKTTKREVGFESETYALATAMTLGLRGLAEEDIDSPSVVWNIIGWYCAYLNKTNGTESMTEAQVSSLQYALRPGRQPLSMPDTWNSSEWVVIERNPEGNMYHFPLFAENLDPYFGALKLDVSTVNNRSVSVKLTDEENDLVEEYLYTFREDSLAGKEFPYVVAAMKLPEVQGAEAWDVDFTYFDLVRANRLTTLLETYGNVKYINTYGENSSTEVSCFTFNGDIFRVVKSECDGEVYESASCGNDIYLSKEDGRLMDYRYISEPEEGAPVDTPDGDEEAYYYDDCISCLVTPGEIKDLVENGDEYTFTIEDVGFGMYSDAERTCTVDKGTLALKKLVISYEDCPDDVYEFTLGPGADDMGVFGDWDGKFRTVTVNAVIYDEYGQETDTAYHFRTFSNAELIPTYYTELALWMNEGFTEEYAYPGDGEDYSIIVTNAMG